jgi:hypothetical protein
MSRNILSTQLLRFLLHVEAYFVELFAMSQKVTGSIPDWIMGFIN